MVLRCAVSNRAYGFPSLLVGALCKRADLDCAVSNRAYGDGFPPFQLVCRSRSPDLDLCFVSLSFNRSRERVLSNYRRLVRVARLKTAPTEAVSPPFQRDSETQRRLILTVSIPNGQDRAILPYRGCPAQRNATL